MKKRQQIIMVIAVSLAVAAALASVHRLGGELVAGGRIGVEVIVDQRWIELEGHYLSSSRGGVVPDQAWEGKIPRRGGSPEKSVRIVVLPNLAGRIRENFVIVRAVGHAAATVVRHLAGHEHAPQQTDAGDRDADRG